MKVSFQSFMPRTNLSFRAVNIAGKKDDTQDSPVNPVDNSVLIEQAKKEIDSYNPLFDFKAGKELMVKAKRDAHAELEKKFTFRETLRESKTVSQRKSNGIAQKDAVTHLRRKQFWETKQASYSIIAVVNKLKQDIALNDAAIAKKNNDLRNVVVGEYRTSEGFSKIAGYDNEKEVLYKYFISEIAKEKAGEEANVPSAVLFFGPKGNGKTTFATAFAQEIGCKNPIKVKSAGMNPSTLCERFYTNLLKAGEEAKEKYEQTGDGQIIFLDEFDLVANEDSTIIPELKEFLKTCYEKYHCIVFAATNYPLKITQTLGMDDSIFPYIISQDPPTKENKAQILKYYLKDKLPNDMTDSNYDTLVKYIEYRESETGGKYSIAQIRNNICDGQNDNPLTFDQIVEKIANTNPNIKDEQLQDYCKAMDIVMKNIVEE